jgi:hypothetical protein
MVADPLGRMDIRQANFKVVLRHLPQKHRSQGKNMTAGSEGYVLR